MERDLKILLPLLLETIRDPAGVAKELTAKSYPREVLWLSMALVTILSVLLVALFNTVAPPDPALSGGQPGPEMAPMTFGLILGGSLVITVFALHFTGQALGGGGDFGDTLLMVVWLQALLIALQVAQFVLFLLMPMLAGLASIAVLGLALWCLSHFVRVVQGFPGMGRAVLTIVLAFLGVGFGVAFIVILIGGATATGGTL